ncbi:MAG: hypothetical protein ACUVQW_05115 [Candidatus Bathycorpusculaceae bacterium]
MENYVSENLLCEKAVKRFLEARKAKIFEEKCANFIRNAVEILLKFSED